MNRPLAARTACAVRSGIAPKRHATRLRWGLPIALLACACGHRAGGPGIAVTGPFLVEGSTPLQNGVLFLNDVVAIDFTVPVDLASADLDSVRFQVFDRSGAPIEEQPMGRFEVDRRPGDREPGRRLHFVPRLPTNETLDNGGFRPGRSYLIQLVGGNVAGPVLRDVRGRPLQAPFSLRARAVDGTEPPELFRDPEPGGPVVRAVHVTPEPGQHGVALNELGARPVEIRLEFDRPLDPRPHNLRIGGITDPLTRGTGRGAVFLEYDDPQYGRDTWIPAEVDLEVNDIDRAVVLLRPIGVLPNGAGIRVVVEPHLESLAGGSNTGLSGHQRLAGSFRTRDAYQPQFDALVENFLDRVHLDLAAPFVEPMAEVGRGYVRASFAFEGTATTLDYRPISAEVILDTDFTQIVPVNGPALNVSGGQFQFRNVEIPQGVLVRGVGTRPMVWLVQNDFRVAGELSVRGGDAARTNGINAANLSTPGGIGVCGGGRGGRGSPESLRRSVRGETGFGPGQRPLRGGGGGNLACLAGCGRGSGGGGGSMATQGDPWYPVPAGPGTRFQQRNGIGGQGCGGLAGAATRTLAGGPAGPMAFVDARTDNDFWGEGVDLNRWLRIPGELAVPVGGSGGGGGGDRSSTGSCDPTTLGFITDSRGGGGGGGGGILVIKALRHIIIEPTGRITADGGNGGGGEMGGSSNEAGGGGGGSGGMVILMAGRSIVLHARGDAATGYTLAEGNSDFSVSADGGVCATGTFGSPVVRSKYEITGEYDNAPLGGFGGLGVVQLMAPPGDPASSTANLDGTNTVLDDNIHVYRQGVLLTGPAKQAMLAWRGYPNGQGILVDDSGNPTNIGSDLGDIQPAPVLLPVPFGVRTRLRSKWIDTGASRRRPLTAPDGQPRGIVLDPQRGLLAGPAYEWAGTIGNPGGRDHGFAAFRSEVPGRAVIDWPAVLPAPVPVAAVQAEATFEGLPAYRVTLAAAVLGSVADRFTGYQAELLEEAGGVLLSTRVLAHSETELWLSPEGGLLPAAPHRLQVRARFFSVVTDQLQGLGPTYLGSRGTEVPVANVRVGFAFHRDPGGGNPADRYPADPLAWVFDLGDPAVQETIRQRGLTYLMWDVTFDVSWRPQPTDVPPALSSSSPRPSLRFLRLPFRF